MTESNLEKKENYSPLFVPIWERALLTLNEANAYFGIGKNTIRSLTDGAAADCALWVGRTRYIKRDKFGKFLSEASVI